MNEEAGIYKSSLFLITVYLYLTVDSLNANVFVSCMYDVIQFLQGFIQRWFADVVCICQFIVIHLIAGKQLLQNMKLSAATIRLYIHHVVWKLMDLIDSLFPSRRVWTVRRTDHWSAEFHCEWYAAIAADPLLNRPLCGIHWDDCADMQPVFSVVLSFVAFMLTSYVHYTDSYIFTQAIFRLSGIRGWRRR